MSHRPAHAGLLAALCGAVLLACNDNRPPDPPGSFDRPNGVAFACAQGGNIRPLSECRNTDYQDDRVMHALVTQSARGEVAAVHLEGQGILDIRNDIPGYTFAPVGELPSAIVTPESRGEVTYVANYGSRDISVLDTATLLNQEGSRGADLQPRVPLPAAPVALVVTPDADGLLVSTPRIGRVIFIPIVRCDDPSDEECIDGSLDAAGLRELDLGTSAARLVTTIPDDDAQEALYALTCGYDVRTPQPSQPPKVDPDTLGNLTPRPGRLAVDAFCDAEEDADCTRRILVADEALPLIHAIDVDDLIAGAADPFLEPLLTGVPTRDVVVTPHVPVSLDDDAEATQYVYAIDAGDGSVLAMQDGRVLDVSQSDGVPSNRVALQPLTAGGRVAAESLAIVTPHFDVTGPAAQYTAPGVSDGPDDGVCLDNENRAQLPRRLRGVFLAIATSDGLLRMVDVHDNELRNCRECPNAPGIEVVSIEDGSVEIEASDIYFPLVGDRLRVPGAGVTTVTRVLDELNFEIDDPDARYPLEGLLPDGGAPGEPVLDLGAPIPQVVRHQPRLANNFVPTNPGNRQKLSPLSGAPRFVIGGIGYAVRIDGSASSADAPGLECIACDSPLQPSYPSADDLLLSGVTDDDAGVDDAFEPCRGEAPGLVCADPDPWASPSQDWFGVWEETIPGTRGGQGRLLGDDDPDNVTGADRVEFRAEIDFCESGILGDDDVAGARADVECNALAAEREPAGDQVVILSPPLPRERLEGLRDDGALEISDDELTACDDLRAGIEEEPDSILAFPIERAYADRLVIGDGTLVRPVGDVSSWKVVQRCVGGAPLQFDIRSRDAFVVSSALTGFQHRVRENTAGRCVVDPERDPRRSGRAWLGCTFRNEAIAFRPRLGPGTVDPPAGTLLRAGAASPAGRVVMDLRPSAFGRSTVVPVQLFYNAVDGRLYVVDIHRRGLIPITLDPFPESSPGSFQ